MKKRKLKKKVIRKLLVLVLALTLLAFFVIRSKDITEKINMDEIRTKEKELRDQYNICLTSPYKEDELTEDLIIEMDNITKYIQQNYNISLVYEDMATGFIYTYKEKTVFYGASLVKLAEALYLYEAASNGDIDLDEKIVYLSSDRMIPARGMEKYKTGDKIPLKEIISYALLYSDNASHKIMQRLIGISNLRNYIKDLGANIYFGDTFGEWSAYDTNMILKRLYTFIKENEELGKELTGWLINDDEQYMVNSELAAHKYGYYAHWFHDIAIVYENNPYTLSIFTNHGATNYSAVIKNISERILKLHNKFYDHRQETCYEEVYK